jgi:formate dehydrogenase maturation protein FdhE
MMVQNKNETVSAEEIVESIPVGSFVTTFWEQFEQSSERARQLRETREDAYFNAVREIIKFNKQYRNSITALYDQARKTNQEVVSDVMHQFNMGKEKETVTSVEREELKNQFKEVSGQMEKLALTPVRSFFHIIDQLEDSFEKNAESGIAYNRERRNSWNEVRKEYVKQARNTNLDFVERSKNSLKELVKTR